MSSINRNPFGVLGFLGIKNFGRNPATFSDQLAPTWDLARQYAETNSTILRVDANINATGYTIYFQVPQDRVWWIHNVGWNLPNPVPVGEEIELAIWQSGTASTGAIPLGLPARVVAGYFGCNGARDFILSPGEQIGVFCTRLIGAGMDLTMTARYTEMAT